MFDFTNSLVILLFALVPVIYWTRRFKFEGKRDSGNITIYSFKNQVIQYGMRQLYTTMTGI